MAYAERMPDRNKTLAVITVAGLHGMALYGLVTGLGVEYIDKVATVLRAQNIPIEKVPPPPPPPETTPVEQATSTPMTPRASLQPPVDALRNPYSANEYVVDVPIRPMEPFTFDPPGPSPTPS